MPSMNEKKGPCISSSLTPFKIIHHDNSPSSPQWQVGLILNGGPSAIFDYINFAEN